MGGFSLTTNAWATNLTYTFTAVLLLINIWMSKDLVIRRIWPHGYKFFPQIFGKQVLSGLKIFMKMAFAGMLMTCFEEWTN